MILIAALLLGILIGIGISAAIHCDWGGVPIARPKAPPLSSAPQHIRERMGYRLKRENGDSQQ